MRLLSVLLLMTLLINACTKIEKEEKTQTITENQAEVVHSMPDEAEEKMEEVAVDENKNEEKRVNEEVKEIAEIKPEAIQKEDIVATKKASLSSGIIAVGFVKLNTMLISQSEMDALEEEKRLEEERMGGMLTLLAARLAELEEEDGIQGFVDANPTSPIDTASSNKQVKVGAFNEVIAENRSIDVDEMVMATSNGESSYTQLEYMRRPKRLKDYTGYKIELVTVYNKSLPLTDDLFKVFGGLSFKEKSENSTTYYLGEFRNKRELEDYLAKVVAPRFAKAKGVKFEQGKEIAYK